MQLASTQTVDGLCIAFLSHISNHLVRWGIKAAPTFTPDLPPRLLHPFPPWLFATGPGSQTLVLVDGDDNDQRLPAPLDDHGLLTINNAAHQFTEVNTSFSSRNGARHDLYSINRSMDSNGYGSTSTHE